MNKITSQLEDSLYESGCDDAMVHSGNGSLYLTFDRLDTSLEKAVSSAIKDVEKNQKLEVAVVEPADFVTVAEIARRAGYSREYIRKLIKGERGNGYFPAPLAGSSSTTLIYSWVEVTSWLSVSNILKNNDALIMAKIIKQFNDQLNNRRKYFRPIAVKSKVIQRI
ncbi:MAG: helix-turn-helix transcriptional regulator [Fidelibacterota bacterium]